MNETAQILAKVSENWLNPRYPLREETIQALQVSTGISRHSIEIALANCFEELTASKIAAYRAPLRNSARDILHVLPSNVFTSWVHGASLTLLFGHRCLLKPSAREPVFARAWKKSLDDVDPHLAAHVDIVAWDEKRTRESRVVVAYGSDETLQKIRSQLLPDTTFAGYGHKLSVAVIFKEAISGLETGELLEKVRRDVEPFHLQGCLSPQILYVEDPRFTRWRELEAMVDVAPKIRPFMQTSELLGEIGKFSPHLSCVGYAGDAERGSFLEKELKESGVSRVCPLGDMQKPPLTWKNGGIDLADLLN